MKWVNSLVLISVAAISPGLASAHGLSKKTVGRGTHDVRVTSSVSASGKWGQQSLPTSRSAEIWDNLDHPGDDQFVAGLITAEIDEQGLEYAENDLPDQAKDTDANDQQKTNADTVYADTLLDKRSPHQPGSTPSPTTQLSSSLLPAPHRFPAPHTFQPPHRFQPELPHTSRAHSAPAARSNVRSASSYTALERNSARRRLAKSDSASSIDSRRLGRRESSAQRDSQSSGTTHSRAQRQGFGAISGLVKRHLANHGDVKEQVFSPNVISSRQSLAARGDHETEPDKQSLSPIRETSPGQPSSPDVLSHGRVPRLSLSAVTSGRTSRGEDVQSNAGGTGSSTPTTQPSTPRSSGRRVSFSLPSSPETHLHSYHDTPSRSTSGRLLEGIPGMMPDGRTIHVKPKSPPRSQTEEQSPIRPSSSRDRDRSSSRSRSPSGTASAKRNSDGSGKIHRRSDHDSAFGDHFLPSRSLGEAFSLQPRTSATSEPGSRQGSASPMSSHADNEPRPMSVDGSPTDSTSNPGSRAGSPDVQNAPVGFRPWVQRHSPERTQMSQNHPGPQQPQNSNMPARYQRSPTLQFLVDLARNAPNQREPILPPQRSTPARTLLPYYNHPDPRLQYPGQGMMGGGPPMAHPLAPPPRMNRIDERWPQPNPNARPRPLNGANDARFRPQARIDTASPHRRAGQQEQRQPQQSQQSQQQQHAPRPASNVGNPQRPEVPHAPNHPSPPDTANHRRPPSSPNSQPGTPERQRTPSPSRSNSPPRLRPRHLVQEDIGPNKSPDTTNSLPKTLPFEYSSTRKHFTKRALSLQRSGSSSALSRHADLQRSSSTSSLSSASSSRSGLSSQSSLSQALNRLPGPAPATPLRTSIRRESSRPDGLRGLLPFAPMTNALHGSTSSNTGIDSLQRPTFHENAPLSSHNAGQASALSSRPSNLNEDPTTTTSSQRPRSRLCSLSSLMRSISPHHATSDPSSSHPSAQTSPNSPQPPTPLRLVDLANRPIPGSRYDAASHDSIPIGQAVRPFPVRATTRSGIGRPAIPIGQAVRRGRLGVGGGSGVVHDPNANAAADAAGASGAGWRGLAWPLPAGASVEQFGSSAPAA